MARKNALLPEVLLEIRDSCSRNANASQAKKCAKLFTEGYHAYGVPQDIWGANRARCLVALEAERRRNPALLATT